MTGAKRAAARLAVLLLCAVALQLIPRLFDFLGPASEQMYILYLYSVLPVCAFLLPLWAGRGGLHPFAGFFPVGGALMIMRTYESPGMGCFCLLLSLVGCVAGQEMKNRREHPGTKPKEHRHG